MPSITPRPRLPTLCGIVALALLCGCSSGGSGGPSRHAARRGGVKQQGLAPRLHLHHHGAQPGQARKPKPRPQPHYASVCPPASRVLAGVYHPYRLKVLDPCRKVTGMVDTIRSEEDGDIHLGIDLDPSYRVMLMQANLSEQSGDLVVELMPRDHGHLAQPQLGDRVIVIGAYVDDTDHGWAEIHPVFGISRNGGPLQRSGPQYGGSPASAASDTALQTCHTNAGGRCAGYGGTSAPAPASSPSPPPAGNCDPNYEGACLDPNVSDYDCAGGGGDGPKYVGRVRVVGTDHYGLDTDGDGIACE
jgi:hypothetical protein